MGEDKSRINTVDIDGVTLAAVKALDARTAAQVQRINELEQENGRLRRQNEKLQQQNRDSEQRLERLEKPATRPQ